MTERVGVTQSQLSKLERNISAPQDATLARLATGYGCPWWKKPENEGWLTVVARVLTQSARYGTGTFAIDQLLTAVQEAVKTARALESVEPSSTLWMDIRLWALDETVELRGLSNVSGSDTLGLWMWVFSSVSQQSEKWDRVQASEDATGRLRAAIDLTTEFLSDLGIELFRHPIDGEDSGGPETGSIVKQLAVARNPVLPDDIEAVLSDLRLRIAQGDRHLVEAVRALTTLPTPSVETLVAFLRTLGRR